MAYVITQKCIGTCDTSCVDVCPCNPIVGPGKREEELTGLQMYIDPRRCIACGACVGECPAAAIYLDAEVPEGYRGDIDRNARFFG